MNPGKTTGNVFAANIVMWTAAGVAVASLLLWMLHVIGPPAGITAGAASILTILAAGRKKRNAL